MYGMVEAILREGAHTEVIIKLSRVERPRIFLFHNCLAISSIEAGILIRDIRYDLAIMVQIANWIKFKS